MKILERRMKKKQCLILYFRIRERKKPKYTHVINDEKYYASFGIEKKGSIFTVLDPEKVKAAYEKAWENRNYEIDKFWSRALYFWGFIAATFVAYTAIITNENAQIIESSDTSIEICLLALGIIFSFAWVLVIKGSKQWQENWEKHIDYLEDFVSGSIYKTIFYNGKRYYSVSKMSEYVAKTVLIVWGILFSQTLYKIGLENLDFIVTSSVILMLVMIAIMLKYGKRSMYYPEKKNGFIKRQRRNNLSKGKAEKEEIKMLEKEAIKIKIEEEEKKTREKQSRSKSDKS